MQTNQQVANQANVLVDDALDLLRKQTHIRFDKQSEPHKILMHGTDHVVVAVNPKDALDAKIAKAYKHLCTRFAGVPDDHLILSVPFKGHSFTTI